MSASGSTQPLAFAAADDSEELARAELYGLLARLWHAPPDAELLQKFAQAVTQAPQPGGFLQVQPGPEPGTFLLGYDRRRPQREWVRLASVKDTRLQFELMRRSIPCGYDDLLIVGTDVVTAVDTPPRRAAQVNLSLIHLSEPTRPD